jgi:hypothetical protein
LHTSQFLFGFSGYEKRYAPSIPTKHTEAASLLLPVQLQITAFRCSSTTKTLVTFADRMTAAERVARIGQRGFGSPRPP